MYNFTQLHRIRKKYILKRYFHFKILSWPTIWPKTWLIDFKIFSFHSFLSDLNKNSVYSTPFSSCLLMNWASTAPALLTISFTKAWTWEMPLEQKKLYLISTHYISKRRKKFFGRIQWFKQQILVFCVWLCESVYTIIQKKKTQEKI